MIKIFYRNYECLKNIGARVCMWGEVLSQNIKYVIIVLFMILQMRFYNPDTFKII